MEHVICGNQTDNTILIYGQGSQTRKFYKEIKKNTDLKLWWTGWFGNKWTKILSFIPGQAGLIELINFDKLKEYYEEIGAQSYCSLFYLPKQTASNIIDEIIRDQYRFQRDGKLETHLKTESNFFTIDTDFDYHARERDGEIYHIELNYGKDIKLEIKEILKRIIEMKTL